MSDDQNQGRDFLTTAAGPRHGLVSELWSFLMHNKKWWLLPILLVLTLMGAFVLLGSAGLAPLIYTVF